GEDPEAPPLPVPAVVPEGGQLPASVPAPPLHVAPLSPVQPH
ncbi:MAG: hypothetical protein QOJ53_799, partial [Sphingomonadales bacterium]|nr:hypothetical protein [Sphingomonadales bacterium]